MRQKITRVRRHLIFWFCIFPSFKARLNQGFLLISDYWWPYRLLDRLVLDRLVVKILAIRFISTLVLVLIEWCIFVRVLFFSVWESLFNHHAFDIFICVLVSVSSHLGNTRLFFRCSEVDPSSFHYVWRLRLVFVSSLHDGCLLLPAFAVVDASARERWFRFVTAARRVWLLEMRLVLVSSTSHILTGRHSFPDWIVNSIDLHCSLSHSLLVTRWLIIRCFCRAYLLSHGSDWGGTSRG